ncbi:unnamed protein product, partial [Fusarium langsethiae]
MYAPLEIAARPRPRPHLDLPADPQMQLLRRTAGPTTVYQPACRYTDAAPESL